VIRSSSPGDAIFSPGDDDAAGDEVTGFVRISDKLGAALRIIK
jgi:hypothetical protein